MSKRKKEASRDTEILAEIYRFMQKERLSELDWEQDGVKVKIKRYTNSKKEVSCNNPNPQGKETLIEKIPEEEIVNKHLIESPIIGVFYRRPSSDSLPFVEEGDTVEKDQTVCIVEAMKLMNEIKAEKRCKIIKVMFEDGEHVTVGQTLFLTTCL